MSITCFSNGNVLLIYWVTVSRNVYCITNIAVRIMPKWSNSFYIASKVLGRPNVDCHLSRYVWRFTINYIFLDITVASLKISLFPPRYLSNVIVLVTSARWCNSRRSLSIFGHSLLHLAQARLSKESNKEQGPRTLRNTEQQSVFIFLIIITENDNFSNYFTLLDEKIFDIIL